MYNIVDKRGNNLWLILKKYKECGKKIQ
jgi:hypothetical protein